MIICYFVQLSAVNKTYNTIHTILSYLGGGGLIMMCSETIMWSHIDTKYKPCGESAVSKIAFRG